MYLGKAILSIMFIIHDSIILVVLFQVDRTYLHLLHTDANLAIFSEPKMYFNTERWKYFQKFNIQLGFEF